MVMLAIESMEDELDRDLIVKIYTQHYGIMKRKALKIICDENTAEETIQDAMLELIKRVKTLRVLSEPQIVAYAVRTVASRAIDYHRKNKHKKKMISMEGLAEEKREEIEDNAESIEDRYEQKELYLQLGDVLAKLSQRDRTMLYMKYCFENTDKEIGVALGISADSVRMTLTRARNKVKSYYIALQKGQEREVDEDGQTI